MHSRWFQIIPEKVLSPQVTSHVFFLVVFGCDSRIDSCRYIWSKRTWFPANYPINQTIETNNIWLVVWNMFFLPYSGNFIIPTDELHHFSWSKLHFDRTSWLNPHATIFSFFFRVGRLGSVVDEATGTADLVTWRRGETAVGCWKNMGIRMDNDNWKSSNTGMDWNLLYINYYVLYQLGCFGSACPGFVRHDIVRSIWFFHNWM